MSERILIYPLDHSSTRAGAHCEQGPECGGKDSTFSFSYDGRTVHLNPPAGCDEKCVNGPDDCPVQEDGREFVDMSRRWPPTVALLAGTPAHYAMVTALEHREELADTSGMVEEADTPERTFIRPGELDPDKERESGTFL